MAYVTMFRFYQFGRSTFGSHKGLRINGIIIKSPSIQPFHRPKVRVLPIVPNRLFNGRKYYNGLTPNIHVNGISPLYDHITPFFGYRTFSTATSRRKPTNFKPIAGIGTKDIDTAKEMFEKDIGFQKHIQKVRKYLGIGMAGSFVSSLAIPTLELGICSAAIYAFNLPDEKTIGIGTLMVLFIGGTGAIASWITVNRIKPHPNRENLREGSIHTLIDPAKRIAAYYCYSACMGTLVIYDVVKMFSNPMLIPISLAIAGTLWGGTLIFSYLYPNKNSPLTPYIIGSIVLTDIINRFWGVGVFAQIWATISPYAFIVAAICAIRLASSTDLEDYKDGIPDPLTTARNCHLGFFGLWVLVTLAIL